MNRIYQNLLKVKIDNFINEYFSSKLIFEDIKKHNNLIHAGEFGLFRERICDEIIKFGIPSRFETGTGFLINSLDQASTQLDIIIFDLYNTPIIQNDSSVRFFPVESVIAIGEIKSQLNIKQLCDATIKLAKNKMMKQIPKEPHCLSNPNKNNFDPENDCYDTIFSFIICEEIKNFNCEKVFNALDLNYENNNIEYQYRHNVIVSLKNGAIGYKNQYSAIEKIIPINQMVNISKIKDYKFQNSFLIGNHFEIMTYLLTSLSNFIVNANLYYPEPNTYK